MASAMISLKASTESGWTGVAGRSVSMLKLPEGAADTPVSGKQQSAGVIAFYNEGIELLALNASLTEADFDTIRN